MTHPLSTPEGLAAWHEAYLAILTPETKEMDKPEDIKRPAIVNRSYTFTINNPTPDDIASLKAIEAKYAKSTKPGSVIIWELEVGWGRKEHTNSDGTKHVGKKTLHVQGYIELTSGRSAKKVKEDVLKCERAYVQPAKGSLDANLWYCTKDRKHPDFAHLYNDPLAWGQVTDHPCPERGASEQGKRTDIEEMMTDIKAGTRLEVIMDKHSSLYLRYALSIEKMMSLAPKVEKPPLKVIWHWGVSGSGKTYDAKMTLGIDSTYIKTSKTAFWWDGYDPDVHKAVVIDEVDKTPAAYALENILTLTDESNVIVQVKGGSRVFRPTHLFLTSTVHPSVLYPKQDDYDQVRRRLDVIKGYRFKREVHCKQTIEVWAD